MSTNEVEPIGTEYPRISEKFHSADSDVIFKSSDGVLFKLHKINLSVNSRGFPPVEFSTLNEIVQMSETSDVLELLFQFCYPYRRPDLESIEFQVLTSLAEAAEKYEVFPAMNMCNIQMKNNILQNAVDVALYAAKHGYTDIMDITYPLVLKEPIGEIVCKLPYHTVAPWVLHYDRYNKVLQRAISYYDSWQPSHTPVVQEPHRGSPFRGHRSNGRVSEVKTQPSKCLFEKENRYSFSVLKRLSRGVGALMDLDDIFDFGSTCCEEFASGLRRWRCSIDEDIQEIPPFHTVL